jgi:hypothetical protein
MIILFSSGPSYMHRPLHQPFYFVHENFHSFNHKFNGCQKKVAIFLYMVQGGSQKIKKKKKKFCSYFLVAKFGYIGLQMIAASATSENQKKKITCVYFFLRLKKKLAS